MSITVLFHLITYAAITTFGLVVAIRFVKIYKMPMHLRWELYPVAHEAGGKASYGGSRLEEVDWWTKPKERSTFNELKVMIPEMTLLVALWEHNRKLWWRSFPFHFGLYILTGLVGLIVLGALMEMVGIEVSANAGLGSLVYYLTILTALGGLSLATIGCLGLLHRRLTDEGLVDYTSMSHIFNLGFFLVVLGIAWLTFLFADRGFEDTRAYVLSLITFDLGAPVGSFLVGLEIFLAVILIAYIPMTHMSHFFIKWFTYHKIRWDDEANEVGSEIEKKVLEQVMYPVTWAAAHVNADGKKNWVDIATEEMEK